MKKCIKTLSEKHSFTWEWINPDNIGKYLLGKVAKRCLYCGIWDDKTGIKYMVDKTADGGYPFTPDTSHWKEIDNLVYDVVCSPKGKKGGR